MRGVFLLFLLLLGGVHAWAGEDVLFRDEFNSIENWRELKFKNIENMTTYESKDGVLNTYSKASASGLIYRKSFNVSSHPFVSWRWKVDSVYEKGDGRTKKGDDYPLRIYIVFQYNPDTAGFAKAMKYRAVKLLYGEYPPDSSLNYVWASRLDKNSMITSPYTDRSKMVVLQTGTAEAGEWVTETVNILEDYEKAFGAPPPEKASIAVMNDSDNTGESSRAYLDYIKVFSQ